MIRLWTSRNERWLSPKYLIGESYGTLRAGALADHLQTRYGFALNGLMLVSSILDIGTADDESEGNDLAFVLSLPTFACLAHYHGLLGDRELDEVRTQAEAFALGDYARALLFGRRLSQAERSATVTQLAGLTGLDPGWIERANLRIGAQQFFRELLRERGQVIGRLDGRFTGFEADAAAAIRANTHLRVQIAAGYYDGATPYFGAEHTVHHMHLPAELRGNVSFRYYDAGHMMYVHDESRLRQSQDLAAFVTPT